MGMLGSMALSVNVFQPIALPFYTYRVQIWAKQGTDDHSGPLGTNPEVWEMVVADYPAQLIPLSSDLEYLPAGLTEKVQYMILLPYATKLDGTLILQERNAVYDPLMNLYHLCLHSEDALHNQQQILGWLEEGVLQLNLAEQQ